MLAATPQPISGRSLAQRGSSYSAATAAADERWGGPVGQEHSAQPSSSSASAGGGGSTKSSRFIALEGILLLLQVVSKKDLTHGEVPFPEELRRVSLAMYLYIYVSSSSPLAAACRSVQD